MIRIVSNAAGMAFFMALLFLIHELGYTETLLIYLKQPKHALIPQILQTAPLCLCGSPWMGGTD